VVSPQVGLRVCLVRYSHDRARRSIALEARARAAGSGHGVSRLRAPVVTRLLLSRLLRLLHVLRGFVELVQVLAKGHVSLHALVARDMMALRFVLRGSLVLALACRQMRLRGRLSRHGGWPFRPRMGIVGGSHAYVLPVRLLRLAADS
jgi:hypothetical protein